jgi:hypothetical protein
MRRGITRIRSKEPPTGFGQPLVVICDYRKMAPPPHEISSALGDHILWVIAGMRTLRTGPGSLVGKGVANGDFGRVAIGEFIQKRGSRW